MAIQLTREMLARRLHRSKRSVNHAIVGGAKRMPATGRRCLRMARHPVDQARRKPRGFALSASEPAATADWRRSGAAGTDHRPRPAENARRGDRRKSARGSRTGVRIAPPSANPKQTPKCDTEASTAVPRPRVPVAFAGGSTYATGLAFRAEQGPWSRRRDARTTTKAGLRRAVASRPERGSSTPGAAVLVSTPSRSLWCLLLPDVSASAPSFGRPYPCAMRRVRPCGEQGVSRPAASSGLRSSHLGGADSRAIGEIHTRGRASVGGCGSSFDAPAPAEGGPGA
jgi:hypothetical protein